MAVIVPNAANASPGQRYEVLNQSEPDSLDFEILGNVGKSGVLFGCEVTAGNGTNVLVSAGVVVLNGVPYTYGGGSSLLPASPVGGADKRYDIAVARVVGNNVTISFVRGTERDTNFAYPPSRTVLTVDTLYDSSTVVDLNNEVVLAAIYRANNTATIRSHIVDKRAAVSSSIPNQGTSDPASQAGALGDLYFRSTPGGSTNSGVFVRRSSEWVPLASEPQAGSGPYVPIGGMLAWPARVGVPTGYVEANGQSLPIGTYPELYSVYGDTHGESGATFNVPNLNGRVPRGTVSVSAVGTAVGADSLSLSISQLPPHSHGLNNHTHNLVHTHTIDHDHSTTISSAPNHQHGMTHTHSNTVLSAGSHQHTGTTAPTNPTHNHDIAAGVSPTLSEAFVFRRGPGGNYNNPRYVENDSPTDTGGYFIVQHSNDPGGVQLGWRARTNNTGSQSADHSHAFTTDEVGAHVHTVTVNSFSGNTTLAGSHTHAITVSGFVGTSGAASSSVTSQSTGNTTETGDGAPVPIVPSASLVRWIIRAK
jgi:microcystin-dependent protein